MAAPFERAYESRPPWDIGRAQPAIVAIAEAGGLAGRVLDVGCGTGEHALLASSRGHDAWGVDIVPRAIELARAKAKARGLSATFRVHDALDLGSLGERFDTTLDTGVFHVWDDDERARYVASLGSALRPGGRHHLLVFSEREPDWGGPRRVRREEIEAAFRDGWRVERIERARFATVGEGEGAHAWCATLRRIEPKP